MSHTDEQLLQLSVAVVSSYVKFNHVGRDDLIDLIQDTYQVFSKLSKPKEAEKLASIAKKLRPAVSIKRSITPGAIICLEDGKPYRSLKRHLRAAYGLTPEEYRVKWGLPADYPMVAPVYSEQRSELAKQNGLGRKAAKVGGAR